MTHRRFLPLAFCLTVLLLPTSSRLLAQAQADFTLLGTGSFTLETASLEKGSRISLETDLQDLASIVIEDTNAGRELVRMETARAQPELQAKSRATPEAEVVINADSIKGKFDHRIDYDLGQTKALKITLTLSNGLEFPFTIYSRTSLTNRRITQTFSSKSCQTITLTCGNGCSTSGVCCTVAFCADCINCLITCGAGACGGGGGGGGGCISTGPQEQQIVTSMVDGHPDKLPLPKSSFTLRRTEPGANGVSYLMEEWALLAYSPQADGQDPGIEVLKASSPEFAAAKSRDLTQITRRPWKEISSDRRGARQTLLIIEAPIGPDNSRLVLMPGVRLSDTDVPPGISPVQVLVRADFAEEDESLRGLQILHSQGTVSEGLLDLLKSRLVLERRAIKHHRTIVFATVKVGKTLELTNLATVLPKGCCSSGPHCV